ncbi:hypothetical protein SGPA1_20743 [Streptomyces misionensis JCM 4497]
MTDPVPGLTFSVVRYTERRRFDVQNTGGGDGRRDRRLCLCPRAGAGRVRRHRRRTRRRRLGHHGARRGQRPRLRQGAGPRAGTGPAVPGVVAAGAGGRRRAERARGTGGGVGAQGRHRRGDDRRRRP